MKAGRSLNILLAEDNIFNQRLAIVLLEKRGHRVTLACNGHEAVSQWQDGRFDLILMDLQMPEMDGIEATTRIRDAERAHSGNPVAIVAMTANAIQGDRERCLAAGMDGYVSKPILPADLFGAIEGLVPCDGAVQSELPEALSEAIDREMLLELTWHDKDILASLVALFADSAPAMLEAVRESLAERDGVKLQFAAHRLKGTLGSLAARTAHSLADRMERMAMTQDWHELENVFSELEMAVRCVYVELGVS